MSHSVCGSSKNASGGRKEVVDLTSFMERMNIANHGRNISKKEKNVIKAIPLLQMEGPLPQSICDTRDPFALLWRGMYS